MYTKFETFTDHGTHIETGYFSDLNRDRGNKLYVGCSAQSHNVGIEMNPTYNKVLIGKAGQCDWADYHAARDKARRIAEKRFSELMIYQPETNQ